MLLFLFALLLSYAAARFPVLPFDLKSYEELQEQASPLFDILMQGVSFLWRTNGCYGADCHRYGYICSTAPMARGDLHACDNQQRTGDFCA